MPNTVMGYPHTELRTIADRTLARSRACELGSEMAAAHAVKKPECSSQVYAFFSVSCLYSSLSRPDRATLIDAVDSCLTLADLRTDYRAHLDLCDKWLEDVQRAEGWDQKTWPDVLQGTAIGIARIADERAQATETSLNHQGKSLVAFVDQVLSGLPFETSPPRGNISNCHNVSTDLEAVELDAVQYHGMAPALDLITTADVIDDWVAIRTLSRSEASRQRTSARQFAQWLEVTDAPITQLTNISPDTSIKFQDHSQSQFALSQRGARARARHIRDFLEHVRALGVAVCAQTEVRGNEDEARP